MPAPEIIHQLVAKFNYNREAYRSGNYNEAQLRLEFLNPFFMALGWDIENKQGWALENRDVEIENSIPIQGKLNKPDYTFKIGPKRKFFVEAKKPSVDIKSEISPAYQVRIYSWNTHLDLGILTDFEEFSVYDCRSKPNPTDKPATARLIYLRFDEYIERWDEIAAIFSKDAVWKGSLDRYAETSKGKKGTTEVDDEFLKDMSEWRNTLARNIALRNPNVENEQQLNYAVQMTIDRIIFLRICEDRGIEPEEQLKTIASKAGIYTQLLELFKRADVKYNSGLFHFAKEKGNGNAADTFTPGLKIDDKVLKEIISSIYYPCPYIFKEIPVEILGQVYEQFLGKVIRLTPGHQAKVEEKPEVRKAGGVYYTPRYIVDYIVANTVGKLLEGKTPEEAAKLKIVDPACGSGSFLLGAFQYLLDWHLKWYTGNDAERWAKGKRPALVQVIGGYKLTTEKKKEILVNNIHGVDIDAQAVEVTKLSLLLKVLEEESGQLSLGFERVLPDLGKNIQCGNSLIGEDYFEGRLAVDPEERRRVNPFDWQRAFPQVFARGGFDAVIGNPPYVRAESLESGFKGYAKIFSSYSGNADLYIYFIEKSHNLLKENGVYGVITSNAFIKANYGKPLRLFLCSRTALSQIIDFGELPVFEDAATFPSIMIFLKRITDVQDFNVAIIKSLDFISLTDEVQRINKRFNNLSVENGVWKFKDTNQLNILSIIEKRGLPFSKYISTKINYGIKTALDDAFIIDQELYCEICDDDPKCAERIKRFIIGDYVRKYQIKDKKRYLILFPKGWTRKCYGTASENKSWSYIKRDFKKIAQHLEKYHDLAIKRSDKGEFWWELRGCEYYDLFEKNKIIWPEIAKESRFTFDNQGFYLNKTCFFTPSNDMYLLAVLNSRLIWFFLKSICSVLGDAEKGGRLMLQKIFVEQIPIHLIDATNPKESMLHSRITKCSERMLDLHKRTPATPQEQERLAREIESTDREIDRLVYKLYGLTEEEIRIVEGS